MIGVRSELRPKAGPTVWLTGSRYDEALTPTEAREFAATLVAAADDAEAAAENWTPPPDRPPGLTASQRRVWDRATDDQRAEIRRLLEAGTAEEEQS